MSDRLLRLFPAHARIRDASSHEVLRALLGVLSGELDRVQDDIERLYDNWFIETCDEWVVPYIGDLLGMGARYAWDTRANSMRPFVANTLGFRRRKGTAAMLEDLGQSLTGWRTRAVELYRLLAATENLNHLRRLPRTPSLRDTNALELLGGPFERAGRFADVRRVEPLRGKYNIPHVALFCWRLLAMAAVADQYQGDGPGVRQPPATPDALGGGRFRFSQLGADMQLFNPARTIDLAARVHEPDVPGPLRMRAVYDEVQAARAALSAGEAAEYRYLSAEEPAFRIYPDGEDAVSPEQIQICDLSAWSTLPPAETVSLPGGGTLTARVAVDPHLGRLAFVSGAVPASVRVSYHYGFSAEMGGGFYDRSDGFSGVEGLEVYTVSPTHDLQTAIADWVTDGRPPALFNFTDSGVYDVSALSVPEGTRVELRARDHQRPILRLAAPWEIELAPECSLTLDGLVIAGDDLLITTTNPQGGPQDHQLRLRHCTLVPGSAGVGVGAASEGRLSVTLHHCIAGRVDLRGGAPSYEGVVEAFDSILDAAGGAVPAVAARDLKLDRVTVLGETRAVTIHASEVIFTGQVLVERTQTGCVRFSDLPVGSVVPRRYRCTHDRPAFTSIATGDPGYAQLAATISNAIWTGAEDGSEMGAFRNLHQPQREANLRAGLAEYLRFGLEAGIFFVT